MSSHTSRRRISSNTRRSIGQNSSGNQLYGSGASGGAFRGSSSGEHFSPPPLQHSRTVRWSFRKRIPMRKVVHTNSFENALQGKPSGSTRMSRFSFFGGGGSVQNNGSGILEHDLSASGRGDSFQDVRPDAVDVGSYREENVTATWSQAGIYMMTLQPGDGVNKPVRGQTVRIQFTGKLMDGTSFGKSQNAIDKMTTFEFIVGRGTVIRGLDMALLRMSVGETCKIVLGPGLAYGSRGLPPYIPACATIILTVHLTSFCNTNNS